MTVIMIMIMMMIMMIIATIIIILCGYHYDFYSYHALLLR